MHRRRLRVGAVTGALTLTPAIVALGVVVDGLSDRRGGRRADLMVAKDPGGALVRQPTGCSCEVSGSTSNQNAPRPAPASRARSSGAGSSSW